jgi:hypothetical protein
MKKTQNKGKIQGCACYVEGSKLTLELRNWQISKAHPSKHIINIPAVPSLTYSSHSNTAAADHLSHHKFGFKWFDDF